MGRGFNDLPFKRGTTYFGGGTTDATSGANLEGKEFVVEDTVNSTGRYVRLRCVRNAAGITLQPKRLVTLKAGLLGQVDGYAEVNPERCFPVDDAYPGGILANDLFYVVVEGPCLVKTPLPGDANNVISQNDFLVNITAATSGATSAGRAKSIDLTGATAVLGNQILNTFGQAMSAKTTSNTDADLLVCVGKF